MMDYMEPTRREKNSLMETVKAKLKEWEAVLGLAEDAEIEYLFGRAETEEEQASFENVCDPIYVRHGCLPLRESFLLRGNHLDLGLLACLSMATELLEAWPMDDLLLERTVEQRKLGRMGTDLSASGVAELMDDTEHVVYHGFHVSDDELLELLDDGSKIICPVSSLLLYYPDAVTMPCPEPDRFIMVFAVDCKDGVPCTVYYVDPMERGILHSFDSEENVPQLPYSVFSHAWNVGDRRTLILQEGYSV